MWHGFMVGFIVIVSYTSDLYFAYSSENVWFFCSCLEVHQRIDGWGISWNNPDGCRKYNVMKASLVLDSHLIFAKEVGQSKGHDLQYKFC